MQDLRAERQSSVTVAKKLRDPRGGTTVASDHRMTEERTSPFVVLAALDLSGGGSPLVVSRALELTTLHPGSSLHVLAVNEPGAVFAIPEFLPNAEAWVKPDVEALARFVRSQVDDFHQHRPDLPRAHVEVHAALGAPADEIVWLAAHLDADVIVVGTHGRTGLKRVLLGSVAEKVVRLAGCQVVVARPKQHAAPWKVPEIEPICPDCASARETSAGATLWCARHAVHHQRAHVYSTSGRSPSIPASESLTGT